MTVAIPARGTALALPDPDNRAAVQLVEWAQAAEAAYQLADRLCATQFAPAAYRGKSAEAAAAILAGAEVGLSPMASLRAFDNIQGTPAPKAITLRAIVQGKGHEIRIDESSPTQAVVSGRRKGDAGWQTCTWTIDRANQAGFPAKNANWKTNPAAMLVARATAEVCRWVASDAIMGMPYTAEEIYDQGPAAEARPAPRRITAADILGVADDAAAEALAVVAEAQDGPEPIRDDQRRHMFALWNDLGFGGDENRERRLDITSKILGLLEPIGSSNDLTAGQAGVVIAALAAKKAERQDGGQ